MRHSQAGAASRLARTGAFALLLAAFAAVTSTVPAMAADYKAEYKLSTVVGEAFPWGFGGKRWAELVREKTDGRINVKMYPGCRLGRRRPDQGVHGAAPGQHRLRRRLDHQLVAAGEGVEPVRAALPDAGPQGDRRPDQGRSRQGPFKLLATKDVVPLAWGENGFREISNSKHAIRTPADLKGLKVRVVGSPLFVDTMTALGGNPAQMSWADAQPAMATKAVDGQENPLGIFAAAKLHTVSQTHLTLWGYVADPLIFVVNAKVWESWSEADRAAVREAAEQAAVEEIAMARKGLTAEDTSLIDQIKANGVEVVTLTEAEKQPFQEATKDVYAKWKKTVGEDLVNKAEAAISER